jgi:hypothetical protein
MWQMESPETDQFGRRRSRNTCDSGSAANAVSLAFNGRVGRYAMTPFERFDAMAGRVRNAYHREVATRGKPQHAAAIQDFEQALNELNEALEQVERMRKRNEGA